MTRTIATRMLKGNKARKDRRMQSKIFSAAAVPEFQRRTALRAALLRWPRILPHCFAIRHASHAVFMQRLPPLWLCMVDRKVRSAPAERHEDKQAM
jgi:hypothetical protein